MGKLLFAFGGGGLVWKDAAKPGRVSSGVLISREWSSSLWFNCVGSCFISQHIEIILVWECKPTHPSFYQIFWPLCLNSLLIIWNTTHCHYTTQHSTANIHAFLSANQTLKTFLLVSVYINHVENDNMMSVASRTLHWGTLAILALKVPAGIFNLQRKLWIVSCCNCRRWV